MLACYWLRLAGVHLACERFLTKVAYTKGKGSFIRHCIIYIQIFSIKYRIIFDKEICLQPPTAKERLNSNRLTQYASIIRLRKLV